MCCFITDTGTFSLNDNYHCVLSGQHWKDKSCIGCCVHRVMYGEKKAGSTIDPQGGVQLMWALSVSGWIQRLFCFTCMEITFSVQLQWFEVLKLKLCAIIVEGCPPSALRQRRDQSAVSGKSFVTRSRAVFMFCYFQNSLWNMLLSLRTCKACTSTAHLAEHNTFLQYKKLICRATGEVQCQSFLKVLISGATFEQTSLWENEWICAAMNLSTVQRWETSH